MYPETPGKIKLLGPTLVADYLTPSSQTFKSLPHMLDPWDGVGGLDDVQMATIRANHDTNLMALAGYYEQVSRDFSGFYKGVKDQALQIDNLSKL